MQFRTFRAQAKNLTVVQYVPQTRAESSQQGRDDVAYLVLDDRSVASSSNSSKVNGDRGGDKGKDKEVALAVEDEEIQVIEPESGSATRADGTGTDTTTRPGKRKVLKQYRTLAVRPAGAVVPMLHNLLNPFVLGVTKSARQVSPQPIYPCSFLECA